MKTRLPITPEILHKIYQSWKGSALNGISSCYGQPCAYVSMDFCEREKQCPPAEGEFDPSQHLSYEDVAVDNARQPSYLSVNIKQSKTDPFQKGIRMIIGLTDGPLCPITAILAYMA